jgi:hypothetical protein
MSGVDEAIRIDHTEVSRNVRAVSDARFLEGAKVGQAALRAFDTAV